ncbi:MAG: SDR family oxidoreductase [bacterium]
MRILIAGGAGYIGSFLIPKLLQRGHSIDVIDLLWFGNSLPGEINVLQKDVFALHQDDLPRYDRVVFLAGLSNDPMAEYSPAKNFIHNASAPMYLAYLAKLAGVRRFVYASSCSIYGNTAEKICDENTPALSMYPYGISKLHGEQGVMQMADNTFSVISLRQGTVSGYSPRMRLDLIVNTMFKSAIQQKEIFVRNPDIWRPVLALEDASSAFISAIEIDELITGIFNVASGNYTVGGVAQQVISTIKRELSIDVGLTVSHIQDYRNYRVSIDLAKRVLGFNPVYDIPRIVQDLIQNREKFSDFANPNYYNIEVFKSIK